MSFIVKRMSSLVKTEFCYNSVNDWKQMKEMFIEIFFLQCMQLSKVDRKENGSEVIIYEKVSKVSTHKGKISCNTSFHTIFIFIL